MTSYVLDNPWGNQASRPETGRQPRVRGRHVAASPARDARAADRGATEGPAAGVESDRPVAANMPMGDRRVDGIGSPVQGRGRGQGLWGWMVEPKGKVPGEGPGGSGGACWFFMAATRALLRDMEPDEKGVLGRTPAGPGSPEIGHIPARADLRAVCETRGRPGKKQDRETVPREDATRTCGVAVRAGNTRSGGWIDEVGLRPLGLGGPPPRGWSQTGG